MKSHRDQVGYLAESVNEVRNRDNSRRKLLLLLLYWKVFDGIEIPDTVMKEILHKGTNPETIYRTLRYVDMRLEREAQAILEGENEDDHRSSE